MTASGRGRASASLRLLHVESGRVLANSVERPRTFVGRGLGLMFRAALPPGCGMWISPCSGIHTFFMRFPIDAVFMDRGQHVVRVYEGLKPLRLILVVPGAHSVVELPAGTVAGLALSPGEQLAIEAERAGMRA